MIPARFAPLLFSFVFSGLMSCIVCGIATLRALGPTPGVFGAWMGAWLLAWPISFPTVMVVAPVARRLVARLTA